MDRAYVAGTFASDTHSFSKVAQPSLTLVAGLGIVGDAHYGEAVQHVWDAQRDPTQPNRRQVHLIHAELLDEVRAKGFPVAPGELGENLSTRGVDLLGLPEGTHLRLGAEVIVEITGLRSCCVQIDDFRKGLLAHILERPKGGKLRRKGGVMGIVLRGGTVRPDDAITVTLPPEPHRPLEVV